MEQRVLIVIPTRDRPWMCLRAIKSALGQTYVHWNMVVAKNDKLKKEEYTSMFSRFHDPRITVMEYPKSGLGYALNRACQGFLLGFDLFTVLEDDDEIDPTYIEELVGFQKETGADVVHCKQRQVPDKLQSDGDHMNLVNIQKRNWINFPECVFKSSLYEDHQFSEECGPSTDWDWHLQNVMVSNAEYRFLDKVLVTHHWHGRNYCQKDSNFNWMRVRIDVGYYRKLRKERRCQE